MINYRAEPTWPTKFSKASSTLALATVVAGNGDQPMSPVWTTALQYIRILRSPDFATSDSR